VRTLDKPVHHEKFVITAGVLLLAVTVDSVARKGRASSGRA